MHKRRLQSRNRPAAFLAAALIVGASLAAALTGPAAPARAASVSWHFDGVDPAPAHDLGPSATFAAADGTTLKAEGFLFNIWSLSWITADIRQSDDGLGVHGKPNEWHRPDSLNIMEVLRIRLPSPAAAADLTLHASSGSPYFAVWTNDDGALPGLFGANGTVLATGRLADGANTVSITGPVSTYLFLTGDYRMYQVWNPWEWSDEGYQLSSLTLPASGGSAPTGAVPLPPALGLFATAIAFLGLFGIRKPR